MPGVKPSIQVMFDVQTTASRQPPPPPFVDPLTSNERLDRIIKNVLADREAELDHRIFFNQSLRDYRSDKECKQSLAETCFLSLWSTFEALEKALNNDRLNSPQEKKNAAVFNARFEEYKAALIQAQEVEVQATQKVINDHPDLEDPQIWSQPSRESLRKSPTSDIRLGERSRYINRSPFLPILERIASKPELSILSDSEDELDEERRAKQARRTDQGPQTPKGTPNTPDPWGLSANPLSDESRASSEMGIRSEDEIPEAESSGSSSKSSVPGPPKNKRDRNPTNGPTSSKRKQPPDQPTRTTTETNSLDQQPQPNPFNMSRAKVGRTTTQDNSLEPKQQRYREESEDLETQRGGRKYIELLQYSELLSPHQKVNSQSPFQSKIMSSLSTINHNITTLESNLDVIQLRYYAPLRNATLSLPKTSSEISDQLSDPLQSKWAPLRNP
ncbi:hypothetical protein H4Q26_018178 [Puccinia striiformis f. sp. tritici PST-130]|nr:hypothetical protein H4Q26_018178 [Puccinia striiformis f. sp. tritici PST-130]